MILAFCPPVGRFGYLGRLLKSRQQGESSFSALKTAKRPIRVTHGDGDHAAIRVFTLEKQDSANSGHLARRPESHNPRFHRPIRRFADLAQVRGSAKSPRIRTFTFSRANSNIPRFGSTSEVGANRNFSESAAIFGKSRFRSSRQVGPSSHFRVFADDFQDSPNSGIFAGRAGS